MPDFAYTARDFAGQKVTGRITAQTEREVLAVLDQKSLFPVEVSTAINNPAVVGWRARRVGGQLMATTYGQLADLLRSGVPLLRSIDVLQRQSSHAGLKEILGKVKADVEEGSTLADAMARHPRVFSEMAINVVRAGGEGGFLEEALDQVGDFTEKQQDLKSRTMGALAYPMVLAAIGTLVVTILLVFFVPKFATLFERLRTRGELPTITEWLLWASETMQTYGLWFLGGLVVGGFFFRRWLATEEGRYWGDRNKLRLPLVGPIMLNLAVSRFCRVLGTMLKNGVPILRSLAVSGGATTNRVLSTAIEKAGENITAGATLAKPLAECGHFPPAVVEMIAVAEEANSLDKVLTDIADGLDRRTWRQLDLAVRLLEPLMLVVLAGIVLVVAVALLMPIFKLSSTMGK
jgi:type II secretory pathway component PulF